jgi:hypothetical protein
VVMRRERLEDLGIICEKLRTLNYEESPMDECRSKHTIDEFIKKYNNEEKLCDLHDWLRWHKEKIEEIYYIAQGYDE